LGQYMMDQVSGGGVTGFLPKLKGGPSRLDDGKSAGITIPNLVNIDGKTARKDFIRGYVMNATGGQSEFPMFAAALPGYGSEWKKEVKGRYVAQARVWIAGGEMLAGGTARLSRERGGPRTGTAQPGQTVGVVAPPPSRRHEDWHWG